MVTSSGFDFSTHSNEFVSMVALSECVCVLPISRMVSMVVDHTSWIVSCDHSMPVKVMSVVWNFEKIPPSLSQKRKLQSKQSGKRGCPIL